MDESNVANVALFDSGLLWVLSFVCLCVILHFRPALRHLSVVHCYQT